MHANRKLAHGDWTDEEELWGTEERRGEERREKERMDEKEKGERVGELDVRRRRWREGMEEMLRWRMGGVAGRRREGVEG